MLACLLAVASWPGECLAARERSVSFTGADGVRLTGMLALPDNRTDRDMPAILLLQGGGPTDRDGNQPPHVRSSLIKTLADALGRQGIASLRYDKRGMYSNAETLPANEADWNAFFRLEAFVGDANAAFRYLRTIPGIDIGRIGMAGHSEGGLIALTASQVLAKDKDLPLPAALVLIATPGRPVPSVIREQLALAFLDLKLPPEESESLALASNEIIASIRASGTVPTAVPARLVNLYPPYLGRFLRSLFTLDPPAFAWGYGGPVLVVNGSEDRQVSATRDADALNEALAARPGGKRAAIVAPGAAHDLSLAGTGQPDPATIHAIAAWVAATLGKASP